MPMEIRALTPDYAVSPQITPEDLAAVKAAGYVTAIDNRPDAEIPAELHTEVMRSAAEALGLTFIANPVIGGAITLDNVRAQAAALAASAGPVFAWCASGNRSSIVWALSQAGTRPVEELTAAPPNRIFAERVGGGLELRLRIDEWSRIPSEASNP